MSQRTFDGFDDYAEDYREIHNRNIALSGADSYYFAEMKIKMLAEFHRDNALQVLDLGCGDGATEMFMQKYFPGWKVQGIDVSKKSIEVAQKRNLLNTAFSVYDGTTIPFSSKKFDIVFVAGVFHHVDESLHKKIMDEINRVMKAGAHLYIFEHNPLNPLTRHLVNTCEFDKDARLVSHRYLNKIIRSAGLEVLIKRFIIFFPRKGFFSKLIFLEKWLAWIPLGGQYFFRVCK